MWLKPYKSRPLLYFIGPPVKGVDCMALHPDASENAMQNLHLSRIVSVTHAFTCRHFIPALFVNPVFVIDLTFLESNLFAKHSYIDLDCASESFCD